MHVNSFRYGHTDLKWRIRGNQNFIWSKKLQGSNLTISNLEKAGVYEFWTESESETSAKVQIDIRMDTPEMIFDKILTYKEIEPSSQWQKEFTASIKLRFSDHPEIPLIRHLLESRNEIHDLQRRESDFFFDLIHMAERYMNALNSTMNAWQRSRPVINYSGQFELKMPQPLETIRLSEVGRAGEKYLYEKYCDPVSESEYVMLPAPEDTLIKITPVAFNGKDWLNVFFHYQPDEIRAANLWDKARLDADKLEQIMLDDTEIATLKTKLTESEKKNWKLERAKNPYDFIVSRPAVTANDSQTFIAVNIPDYDLLAATEKAFYVSVREEDLLFRDDFDYLVPVTGPEVYIDRGARNIDGNVFSICKMPTERSSAGCAGMISTMKISVTTAKQRASPISSSTNANCATSCVIICLAQKHTSLTRLRDSAPSPMSISTAYTSTSSRRFHAPTRTRIPSTS